MKEGLLHHRRDHCRGVLFSVHRDIEEELKMSRAIAELWRTVLLAGGGTCNGGLSRIRNGWRSSLRSAWD
jgi:hypothetical protein